MGLCGSKDNSTAPKTSPTPGPSPERPVDTAPVDTAPTKPKFSEQYKLGQELGSGAFAVVKEGSHKATGESYAVKIVTKSNLTKEDEDALKDEIAVLEEMQHPNVIRLHEVFVEEKFYYLVTEKMNGGELFDRIVQKAYYNEKEARDTSVVLFRAISYCHSKQVAHRDLKPENLLLLSSNNDSNIKIADFGFAKKCLRPQSLKMQCGTPGYVAPEILEGTPYDTQADLWSLGVIMYILLGGYPPFHERNQRDLFRKIRKGQYEFHEGAVIQIGRIDGIRPGILGSMMGTDRVCPHHLIGVDWAQNQST